MKAMKRLVILGLMLLGNILLCTAQEDASTLLARMEQRISELGPYSADYSIKISDDSGYESQVESKFHVAGDSFYIFGFNCTEIYCDGTVCYVVNREHQEVVIENPDSTTPAFEANPAHAFYLLDELYDYTYMGREGRYAVIEFKTKPKKRNQPTERVLILKLDTQSYLPAELIYYPDGECHYLCKIWNMHTSDEPIPRFNPENYPDFELIDFR